jgi:hypothetical protein
MIFLSASKSAIKTTYQNKKNAVKNIATLTKSTYLRYKENGIKESAKQDALRIQNIMKDLPDKTRNIYNNFIVLPRDKKIEVAAATIMTAAIFFACGGGFDMEGGLPDMDISVAGIGHHRSIFSHSIIIGLGVEFTGHFTINLLGNVRNSLPTPHHYSWDRVYNFIDSNKGLAFAAMWAGVGLHLIKDSGILMGGTKPYADIPIGMPMEGHQGLFAANGIVSELFGTSIK